MQSIIEKYEKILEKPMPEPFKSYIEELIGAIKGGDKPKRSFRKTANTDEVLDAF